MKPKDPVSVWLFVAFSWLIAWPMMLDGLSLNLLNAYFSFGGRFALWMGPAGRLGLQPAEAGWLLLMAASALLSASFGLALGQRWSLNVGLGACIFSLLYLGGGTLLALGAVMSLLWPSTRAYLRAPSTVPPK
jgi:hypothetical protein